MPRNLLDLSDEIIQRIAYFVHYDHEVPIPSFNPHWANFASEISPKVQHDYLKLRLVSRRLRDICTLKNLYMKMDSWQKLLKWSIKGPEQVKKAITRLVLDISRRTQHPLSNGSRYQNDMVPIWITTIDFLRDLTSLRELVVVGNPLCDHRNDERTTLDDITNSVQAPLPYLVSLSIETKCEHCVDVVPRLFIRLAPALKHLKFAPPPEFDRMAKSVVKRVLSDTVNQELKTLSIRNFNHTHKNTILAEIVRLCPHLQELHMATYSSSVVKASYLLHCLQETATSDWTFKMTDNNYDGYRMIEFDNLPEGSDQLLNEFLVTLSQLKNLRVLDCLIECEIHSIDWDLVIVPSKTERKTDYQKYRSSHKAIYDPVLHKATNKGSYGHFESPLRSAAKLIAQAVPSLEKGYFWVHEDTEEVFGLSSWMRWEWTCKRTIDQVTIALESDFERFSESWMSNKDGQSKDL
ncbi:uncharacterized protein I206_106027 [Kwoniella pini CBS 10737]|uniref:F-box domain-containing protein n=1 Tax=Kwoniella pini CBS 10737 TaxID=1296096 RepID=A0A1B9I0U0_9TREE|nr:uncharacterized protein I206_04850 [Kwoniella pini CBS 10737]OCF49162.1 hypothetical protein I206_04850 [Kwoniella pini CBS 10737]